MKNKLFSIILCSMLVMSFAVGCVNNSGNTGGSQYNPPHEDALALHLSFDEDGGEVLDSYGDAYPVEYVFNNAQFKESEYAKRISEGAISGNCLAFDGYSNFIEMPGRRLGLSGKKLTIDVFVSPRVFEWDGPNEWANGYENLQVIVSNTDIRKNGYVLGMHKYGDWSFQVATTNGLVKVKSPASKRLKKYEWNHITCVYDGEEGYAKTYLNGELVQTNNCGVGEIVFANTPFFVGKKPDPQVTGMFALNMYNGLMDELRIYNDSWSAEEVSEYDGKFKKGGSYPVIAFEDAWLDETILDDDYYKPQYHAAPPQHWMNEPHALFYYNGNYHLFYQFNPTGPYWRNICWGHWVSPDMVSWRNVKEAIVMQEGTAAPDGIWSGCATIKPDGTPALFITAGDDSRGNNPYSNQNVAIATPVDLNDPDLTEWVIGPNVATLNNTMGAESEFRDPNIMIDDGVYYMVVGGQTFNGRGTAYLYSSTDPELLDWQYHGHIFEPQEYPSYLGSTWELVNIVKLSNKSNTISKYLFAISPAGNRADNDVYYYLGNFDKTTKKFIAENREPMLMDYGNNVFTGPTITTLPDGRAIICSIIQDQRSERDHYNSGWAHTAGVPRQLSLDDEGNLKVTAIEELENLHDGLLGSGEGSFDEIDSAIKTALNKASDKDMLNLKIKFSSVTDGVALRLKKQDDSFAYISFDKRENNVFLNTRGISENRVKGQFGGYLDLSGEVELDVYIDHAMVTVYLNGYKTITAMIYGNGKDIELVSNNNSGTVSFKLYQMSAI